MADHAGGVAGGAGVRGFLFADLRGYTSFVEARGDTAGAALLDRYRDLVRDVVGRREGAEVRTEGDSFYVVFATPSSAVLAALDIVDAAARATAEGPELPIHVGIGVHAGETAETVAGPVGGAVNIAARICAHARSGEVLVSDTVRGLVRTSLLLAFVDRGRPALKGVNEPTPVWAVRLRRDGEVETPLRRRGFLRPAGGRTAAIAGAVGIGAIAMVALILGLARPGPDVPTTPGPGGDASASATQTGRLSSGPSASATVYNTREFAPAWSAVIDTYGLLVLRDESDWVRLGRQTNPLDHRIDVVNTLVGVDGCGPQRLIEPGPLGMIDFFKQHPDLSVESVEGATIGGHAGYFIKMLPPIICSPDPRDPNRGGTSLFLLDGSAIDVPGIRERHPQGPIDTDPLVLVWVADVAGQTVTIVASGPRWLDVRESDFQRFVEGIEFR